MQKIELHLHTEHSPDSAMKLYTLIAACKKRGITTLFVTDHNEIDGAFRLQKIAPFRVIPSEEITTSEGELIGYFLKERIRPYLTPEATIAEIRRQGGVVSVPHPFDRLRKSRMKLPTLQRIINQVDILEVGNSRNIFSDDDRKAKVYAEKQRKLKVVASDAHTHWEVGRSTVALGDFSTPQEFLSALQSATLSFQRSPIGVHFFTKFNKMRSKLGLRSHP